MTANRMVDLAESDGVDLSRRRFLSVSAAVGGGLLIGFTAVPSIPAADAAPSIAGPPVSPHALLPIRSGGQDVLTNPYLQMGPRTHTSLPLPVARELEAA